MASVKSCHVSALQCNAMQFIKIAISVRFFLQISLPLTFWNLNEYKAEDHAWPTEFLYEMCSEIFFKMGGLMSNLWKCTNQLFGAAQPIVMYKPEQ